MEPRRVLFVCTANICRSPTAELLARGRFGEKAVMFRSAGLLESGKTMPDELGEILGERDISTAIHRSSQLETETLGAAELILTMEGRHVQEIAISFPDVFAKTLPLLQAASLIRDGYSIERLLEVLEDRDGAEYLSSEWDVSDPYKRGKRQYRKMVSQVDDLVERVVGPIARSHVDA